MNTGSAGRNSREGLVGILTANKTAVLEIYKKILFTEESSTEKRLRDISDPEPVVCGVSRAK